MYNQRPNPRRSSLSRCERWAKSARDIISSVISGGFIFMWYLISLIDGFDLVLIEQSEKKKESLCGKWRKPNEWNPFEFMLSGTNLIWLTQSRLLFHGLMRFCYRCWIRACIHLISVWENTVNNNWTWFIVLAVWSRCNVYWIRLCWSLLPACLFRLMLDQVQKLGSRNKNLRKETDF